MIGLIEMIFGIQMCYEEMQVKFEYGCCPIIVGEVIALGLRKLMKMTVPFHILDLVYISYATCI